MVKTGTGNAPCQTTLKLVTAETIGAKTNDWLFFLVRETGTELDYLLREYARLVRGQQKNSKRSVASTSAADCEQRLQHFGNGYHNGQ